MFLLIGAFLAGVLTVLAPCVLPLLPVIIGGSVSGNTKDRRRPLLIAGSLAVSLILFTLLLKVTTLLINVPPRAITYFSGGIIIALGLVMLFPAAYPTIIARLGIEHRALKLLGKGTSNRNTLVGPIITGAALGPVFSSCSPFYGYILATVLPAHFGRAMVYIVAYVLGLSLVMLAIGVYGQRLTSRIKFASNPSGYFQRSLAVLFIAVGILVFTGVSTKLQTYAAGHTLFKTDNITAKFLPSTGRAVNDSSLYNVTAYPAPEITGIQSWINSQPQTLAQLKGKVVLVDFWTYSCINCIRTLPYVQGWYSQYQKDGLVVIGVHAPEFAFEKVPDNVSAAVKNYKLTYPVALDNDLATWSAFRNQYWPAEYLIDRSGNVVRQHFGEGEYDQTEKAIRGLLAQGGQKISGDMVAKDSGGVPVANGQTPETYLGGERANAYTGNPSSLPAGTAAFRYSDKLRQNEWSLSGKWNVSASAITAIGDSRLKINFAAKNVYLVAGASSPANVGVSFNGQPISQVGGAGEDVSNSVVSIGQSRLYKIASFKDFTTGTLELNVADGANLNTFTFGN